MSRSSVFPRKKTAAAPRDSEFLVQPRDSQPFAGTIHKCENLRVRFQIDVYAIEYDPFAIRRRHRRADALQFSPCLEGEWTFW